MANILLNALAATAGGGLTYLRNVLPRLAEQTAHRFIVLLPEPSRFPALPLASAVALEVPEAGQGLIARLQWEQWHLRRYLREREIALLVALGNFALLRSPVPQLLFNRNALYFTPAFDRDLWQRGCYADLLLHKLKSSLARLSIRQATVNVTPTKAFAQQIQAAGFAETPFEVLPFGFDPTIFTAAAEQPLSAALAAQFKPHSVRLLFVSHYNYFRNFETLLRALPLLKRDLAARTGQGLQLVLTTKLQAGAHYGGYDATRAAQLIETLGLADDLVMLGAVPYEQLHQLYRACELVVCPSYAESFGHPLLEALASGVPVVAANLPVHREVGGDAALYFDVFDAADLAAQCLRVLSDAPLQAQLRERGLARSRAYSWDAHCQQLLALIERQLSATAQKV